MRPQRCWNEPFNALTLLSLLSATAGCAELPTDPAGRDLAPVRASVHHSGFHDNFPGATLDPAWTVLSPARVIFPAFPPNHHSLTDRPGFLRYYLDPWTHGDGFFNGHAPTFSEHSCCTHDAGLELQRTITGEHWRLEARGEFWLPFSNGRWFTLRVYFGNGGPGTYAAVVGRGRDVNQNYIHAEVRRQDGTSVTTTFPRLASESEDVGVSAPVNSSHFFRIERNGSMLSAGWSHDGATWTMTSYDAGSGIAGLPQTVVLSGLMWSSLPTTYVDWDYIQVEPTVITVAIDITPGATPNSINPRARGVIPVAILSTAQFDATLVNAASVRFGATGTEAVATHSALEDVDSDGNVDLLLHFPTQSTGISCGMTTASLTGATTGEQPIQGSAPIVTVGCR